MPRRPASAANTRRKLGRGGEVTSPFSKKTSPSFPSKEGRDVKESEDMSEGGEWDLLPPTTDRRIEDLWAHASLHTFSLDDDIYLFEQVLCPPQKPLTLSFAKEFSKAQRLRQRKALRDARSKSNSRIDATSAADSVIGGISSMNLQAVPAQIPKWSRQNSGPADENLLSALRDRLKQLQEPKHAGRMHLLRELCAKRAAVAAEEAAEQAKAKATTTRRKSSVSFAYLRRPSTAPNGGGSMASIAAAAVAAAAAEQQKRHVPLVQHLSTRQLERDSDLLIIEVQTSTSISPAAAAVINDPNDDRIRVSFSRTELSGASTYIREVLENGTAKRSHAPEADIVTISTNDSRYDGKAPHFYQHLTEENLKLAAHFLHNQSLFHQHKKLDSSYDKVQSRPNHRLAEVQEGIREEQNEVSSKLSALHRQKLKDMDAQLTAECEEEVRRIRRHYEVLKAGKRREIDDQYEKYISQLSSFFEDEVELVTNKHFTLKSSIETGLLRDMDHITMLQQQIVRPEYIPPLLLIGEDLCITPLVETLCHTVGHDLLSFCSSCVLVSPFISNTAFHTTLTFTPSHVLMAIIEDGAVALLNSNVCAMKQPDELLLPASDPSLLFEPDWEDYDISSNAFIVDATSSEWHELCHLDDDLLLEERDKFYKACRLANWNMAPDKNGRYRLPPSKPLDDFTSKVRSIFRWRHHTYDDRRFEDKQKMLRLQRLCNLLSVFQAAKSTFAARQVLFTNKLSQMSEHDLNLTLQRMKFKRWITALSEADRSPPDCVLDMFRRLTLDELERRKATRGRINLIPSLSAESEENTLFVKYADPVTLPHAHNASTAELSRGEVPQGGLTCYQSKAKLRLTRSHTYVSAYGDINLTSEYDRAFMYRVQINASDMGEADIMVGWDITPLDVTDDENKSPPSDTPATLSLVPQYFSLATTIAPPRPSTSIFLSETGTVGVKAEVPLSQLLRLRASGCVWQNNGTLHFNGSSYDCKLFTLFFYYFGGFGTFLQ